jgi:uncharacterized protein
MPLPITALFAGIFAIFMVLLSLHVSVRRIQIGNGSATGSGDEVLWRRIRAHGNFAEYVPTALIALAMVEYSGASSHLIISLYSAFLFSRLLHAAGMLSFTKPTLRALAMLIQHTVFIFAGIWLMAKAAHVFM